MTLPDWHYIANVWITHHVTGLDPNLFWYGRTAERASERASWLASELASEWERKRGSGQSHQLITLWIVLVLKIIRDMSTSHLALLLLANSYAKYRFLLKKKRCAVHLTDDLRKMYGEFQHLYWQVQNHPGRGFKWMRTFVETFDFLLRIVNRRLQKQTANYRQPVSHAERLVVTIM